MWLRTFWQLDEKSKEILESRRVIFSRSNKTSKHLKATLSLAFFPKPSGNTRAALIKPEIKEK